MLLQHPASVSGANALKQWPDPSGPCVLAPGTPWSLLITLGSPCCRNNRFISPSTDSVRPLGGRWALSTYRLNASRTFSGSHQLPSAVRHQPL